MVNFTTDTILRNASYAPGEDVSVTSNARLTIDFPPHLLNGILGRLLPSLGVIAVDARRYKFVTVSGVVGATPPVLTPLVGGGITGLFAEVRDDGRVAVAMEGDAVWLPGTVVEGGGFSFTVDDVAVGFFNLALANLSDTAFHFGRLEMTGDFYVVGLGTGVAGQTLTLPHRGNQNALWLRSPDGDLSWWHRIPDAYNFANYPPDLDRNEGVYKHDRVNGVLVFGSAIPAGWEVVIPSLHVGTGTVAAPLVEPLTGTQSSVMPQLGATYDLRCSGANISSVYFSRTSFAGLSYTADFSYTTFGSGIAFTLSRTLTMISCATTNMADYTVVADIRADGVVVDIKDHLSLAVANTGRGILQLNSVSGNLHGKGILLSTTPIDALPIVQIEGVDLKIDLRIPYRALRSGGVVNTAFALVGSGQFAALLPIGKIRLDNAEVGELVFLQNPARGLRFRSTRIPLPLTNANRIWPGSICNDIFDTDTAGRILLYGQTPDEDFAPGVYQELSGSPLFDGNGRINYRAGDSWQWTTHPILGHTALTGVASLQGTNTAALTVDFAIRYGGGDWADWGDWQALTPEALQEVELDPAAYWQIRLRVTATGAGMIYLLDLETVTTVESQKILHFEPTPPPPPEPEVITKFVATVTVEAIVPNIVVHPVVPNLVVYPVVQCSN